MRRRLRNRFAHFIAALGSSGRQGRSTVSYPSGADMGNQWSGRRRVRHTPGPLAIAVDHRDQVWVTSTNHYVQQFTTDGRFLQRVSGEFRLFDILQGRDGGLQRHAAHFCSTKANGFSANYVTGRSRRSHASATSSSRQSCRCGPAS